jgi:nucleotide-binding universal stress UspA family protein
MDLASAPDPGPILVGVERSERSRDAVALARKLARAAGTRLILVSVYPHDRRSFNVGTSANEAPVEQAEATLEWVARPISGLHAELRAVSCTSVSRGLQQVALEESALAVVVGPSHRGALGRIVPGSVGGRLLHGAPCPVAVAPGGYWGHGHAPIRRIGIGYAGTPEGGEALKAAFGLARAAGAAVRVLSVVEPMVVTSAIPLGLGYGEREDCVRADLTHRLEQAIYRVAPSPEISAEVVDGYADDELARLSQELDLLVCGSRGHSPLGSVMLGSVSAGVLRKARCPVLITPRGAHDGFAALSAHTQAAA